MAKYVSCFAKITALTCFGVVIALCVNVLSGDEQRLEQGDLFIGRGVFVKLRLRVIFSCFIHDRNVCTACPCVNIAYEFSALIVFADDHRFIRDYIFQLRIKGVESVVYDCLLIDHYKYTSLDEIVLKSNKRIVEKMCLSCYNHYIKINV